MAADDQSDIEQENRQQTQGQQPGGRSSRGPEINAGGEEDVQGAPPYEGRTGAGADTTDPDDAAERTHKAFDASNAPEPGSPPPVADEEKGGMSATDTRPEPQHGVGESPGRSGEDEAPDRDDVERQGPSGRPAGKVDDDAAF